MQRIIVHLFLYIFLDSCGRAGDDLDVNNTQTEQTQLDD